MQETGSRITVLVKEDGFSIYNGCARSEWLGAGCIFSQPEFQKRYDEVCISVFTPKFTLVPEHFFSPERAREILAETVTLNPEDQASYAALPQVGAVAVFSTSRCCQLARVIHESLRRTDGSKGELYPEQYHMLKALDSITDYNKIIASYADGYLHLVVAQGRTLLLCNSFEAADFTTAEYFLFLVLRKFQLNPEVSTLYFRTPLRQEEEESLYGYFHAVESFTDDRA